MSFDGIAALVILVLTYAGVAVGRIPGFGSTAPGSPSSAARR